MRQIQFILAKRAVKLAVIVTWMSIWCGRANAAQPFFIGLGDLPGGTFSSSANAVSADGSVVVGMSSSTPGWQAFRWTQSGGMVGLGDLPGANFYSVANAVSDDGIVVVGSSNNFIDCGGVGPCRNRPGAFRWTQASGMTLLGTYGSTPATASDVSADGSVVVGNTFYYGGFRWTQESGMQFFPGVLPLGVSEDGSDMVCVDDGEVFRWMPDAGMVSLGELGDLPGGGTSSSASGISADGSVIVGRSTSAASGNEAFRWTQSSGIIGLGVRSGFDDYSWALDVSDGSVVIGFNGISNTSAADEAFLWDPTHGMRSLRDVLVNDFGLGPSLAGWALSRAEAISADGQFIVGSGINPSGNREAWLARMELAPILLGDFNYNDTVDAADYVVWRKNPGGIYAQNNYVDWRANFGATLGVGSGAALPSEQTLSDAAVPEPSSQYFAAFLFSALWLRFTHRREWTFQSINATA